MKVFEFLNKSNWTKGELSACGYYCFGNAIRQCYSVDSCVPIVIQHRILKKIRELFPDRPHCCIMCFNDDPATTLEDVLRVARECDV